MLSWLYLYLGKVLQLVGKNNKYVLKYYWKLVKKKGHKEKVNATETSNGLNL